MAEAGYPKGFDAVELATDAVFAPEAEAVLNGLQSIGIRARDQAGEMDPKRREALLYERAMFAPIVGQAGLIGVGPRLAEVPTITGHPFVSPYEDLRLK